MAEQQESSFKRFRRKVRSLLEKNIITRTFIRIYDSFRVYGIKGPYVIAKRVYMRKFRLKKQIRKIVYPDPARLERERNTKWESPVAISVVVPLYNTPENFLRELLDSVVNQTFPYWELCLADGSEEEKADFIYKIVEEYCKNDSRIKYQKLLKNDGISGNTNAAIDMATSEYIGLLDHDDVLHPSLLFEVEKAIQDGADMIYTDELTFEGTLDNAITIHLKPDFAIDNLRANNYICHFTTFSRELLTAAGGGLRSTYDGSQDFDLVLRLSEKAKKIVHIPELLYFWRSHPSSVASDISAKPYCITSAKKAIGDHLERLGIEGEAVDAPPLVSLYKVNYKIKGDPLISIIIPSKDHVEDLALCLKSIAKKTSWTPYEIIICENNSQETETFKYYEEISKEENIQVVTWDKEFNYAAINNYAAKYAKGEYLLFLNNDIEVISDNWLEEMLMYAQRADVGAIGAKLFYKDCTIQHAGIVINEDGVPIHAHLRRTTADVGYMGRLYYAQNYSAVTGACLMVSKEKFTEVNGFSEEFAVAYNDVDFCLKLIEKGYLNVWTPFAQLFHYESLSRGSDTKEKEKNARLGKELIQFQNKWANFISQGDPYYNPLLNSYWEIYYATLKK